MKTKELKKIAKKLENLEVELKSCYGLNKISGGFVCIDMIDHDKEFIYINVKDGVQSDCTNSVNREQLKLDRITLNFTN